MRETEVVGESQPLISTPEYMRNRARGIHGEINRQGAFLAKLSPERRREWQAMRKRWVAWYSAGPNWLWGSTDHTLNDYAREVSAWNVELQTAGAPSAVNAPEPTESALSSLTRNPLVWAGLGLLLFREFRAK